MPVWALCLIGFALTMAETWVATLEGRADRQATAAPHNRFSLKAAHWAAVFETILLLDIALIVHSGVVVGISIVIGAWLGKYIAVERRRRRFRPRKKLRRLDRASDVSGLRDDGLEGDSGSGESTSGERLPEIG